MKMYHVLNRMKTGGRGLSLLVMLLTTLSLPLSLWAANAGASGMAADGDGETGTGVETYDLYLFDVQVTSENADDILGPDFEGTARFEPGTNILTLENIELPAGIVTGLDDLTIKVKGTCKIYEEEPQSVISYEGQGTGTLTILKDETAQDECSLTLNCYAADVAPVIAGFSSFGYDNFYMLSDAASWMTNSNVKITGGGKLS